MRLPPVFLHGVLPKLFDTFDGKRSRVNDRSRDVADLCKIEGFERAAEGEHGAESIAFMHLGLESRHLPIGKFGADMLERTGLDGGARSREQSHKEYTREGLFLLTDQPDGFGGLGGIELRTLDRDDDEISSADSIGDCHRRGSFEVHDDERRLGGCILYLIFL